MRVSTMSKTIPSGMGPGSIPMNQSEDVLGEGRKPWDTPHDTPQHTVLFYFVLEKVCQLRRELVSVAGV